MCFAQQEQLKQNLEQLLEVLYENSSAVADDIIKLVTSRLSIKSDNSCLWDQTTGVLITYGDQIRDAQNERSPLYSQSEWLMHNHVNKVIPIIHILPPHPSDYDDGFAIKDPWAIEPKLGTWEDIRRYQNGGMGIMFDHVLNHQQSKGGRYFEEFCVGTRPNFFVTIDNPNDPRLNKVVRPRSIPLTHSFNTARGNQNVWTTFSEMQADLNFQNPLVLREMIDVLLNYVENGAKIIRLDAVAFLWKELGTNCLHHPMTYQVVRVFRTILDAVAPDVIMLTETNVPHQENISYFGNGNDMAHMVYQFPLGPMLLHTLRTSNVTELQSWLQTVSTVQEGTTFLNFTACHDGIAVRPLEGLVADDDIKALIHKIENELGGLVSMRQTLGGERPYEIGCTFPVATGVGISNPEKNTVYRKPFMLTQTVAASLKGVPATYFQALIGAHNDMEGYIRCNEAPTNKNRQVNRHRYTNTELDELLRTNDQIFKDQKSMLDIRRKQSAFHPDAEQVVLPSGNDAVLAIRRRSKQTGQQILVLANFSTITLQVDIAGVDNSSSYNKDLLTGSDIGTNEGDIKLEAHQVLWLE